MTEKVILAVFLAGAAFYTAKAVIAALGVKDGASPCAHCTKDCPARATGERGECP